MISSARSLGLAARLAVEGHGGAQALEFVRAQLTGPTAWQPSEADRTDRGATQPNDTVTDRLQHAAHLAIAPLVDRHLNARASAIGGQCCDERRRGWAVRELDPPPQRLDRVAQGLGFERRLIDLPQLVPRMGDAVLELPVGGEQQQSRAVAVEPPRIAQVRWRPVEEVVDRLAASVVAPRDDDSLGACSASACGAPRAVQPAAHRP